MVLAVDVYTKWVELGVADGPYNSTWVADWMHLNITCRYGCPAAVRTDKGTEFQGAFKRYLEAMGIEHRLISTNHPRANGLAERYVGVVKAGFRRLKSECPGGEWYDFIPEVLLGLRMLPSRVGYSPFMLVYKQSPYFPYLCGEAMAADARLPT